MKKFNHAKIIAEILSLHNNLKVIKQRSGNAYEFEDTTDGNGVGRLEIIPASDKYFYTIYLSFYDAIYFPIKQDIVRLYIAQKKQFTKPLNVIMEDRNENKCALI
jgi:hypothetical protein